MQLKLNVLSVDIALDFYKNVVMDMYYIAQCFVNFFMHYIHLFPQVFVDYFIYIIHKINVTNILVTFWNQQLEVISGPEMFINACSG